MSSLQARLTSEGYDVTTISHLTDGLYKNAYWDAVIGHSQGAIDALRDAPELARHNPQVTIVTIDPPRTSILFRCVPGARYLNLHTREFGLGGGSSFCGLNSEAVAGDMRPIHDPGHLAIRSDLFLVVAAAVVGDFEDFVSQVFRLARDRLVDAVLDDAP